MLLLVVSLFLFKNSITQNLIQNPSFESYTNTLNCFGGFDNYNANPIYHVLDDWYTLNSCDYYSGDCNVSTFYSTPLNVVGNQTTKFGVGYVGGIFFQANYETKEYIYQQLSSPLQAGKIYCLSFYVSRADRITHAVHSIGAYFSNSVQSAAALGYVNASPQIINQSGFVTDTANWVQIQGCFTASGGEQYITIGNFNSNANTDTLFVGSNDPEPSAYKYAYYYIDDITLIDQSTVGIKNISYELGEMSIYPNPANDILNISLGIIKENTEIKIYNALGELVLTESLITQHTSLKTHHLQSGIYFYSILVGEKTIKTDKIVIIK